MQTERLIPKIVTVLSSGYTLRDLVSDLTAGLVVGIVALPLAIAFAIASGVKPEQGLYTAIIAGFVVALFGGSRFQVSGPTGAFVVVVYGIVQQYGYSGLAVATFLAGIILMGMGFLRMGVLLRFIPYPVLVGFTTGIAVIIFSGQVRDFFGLELSVVPAGFIEKWGAYAAVFDTVDGPTTVVAVISLLLVTLTPQVTRRVPGSLVAILGVTTVVAWFGIPVDTIGSRFSGVPHNLPTHQVLDLRLETIRTLFSAALTIAFLGAIESLLSAVVADGMTGTRHRSNMELIAQGLGNVLSPIFGGIPATGAIARTATNIRNGARTPVAAMFHAVVLLVIMVLFGEYASLIPMATLSAILIVVAYNMSDLHAFRALFQAPPADVAVLLTTFFLTVLIDLTVAIEVGVVLAAFLFLKRMENVSEFGTVTAELGDVERDDPNPISSKTVPPGVQVFELFGPLFFGVVERFKNSLSPLQTPPRVLIFRMRHVPAIDASGLRALQDTLEKCARERTVLLLSSLRPQPLEAIRKSDLWDRVGAENVLPTFDAALLRAHEIVSTE